MATEQDSAHESGVSRAAFLGGLLAVCSLVALSVVGVGHSRSLAGAANTQYWIIVALVSATLAVVTAGLWRTRANTRTGDAARRLGAVLGAIWLAIFLWEAVAIGALGGGGPFELVWAALSRT